MTVGARGLGASALLAVALLVPADADAGAVMPVVVLQQGPKPIQVEIAAGRVGPCDAGGNVSLFKGWVAPGATVRGMSPYGCVCYRQTYDDFPDTNWSPSTVTCRPQCGWGRFMTPCPANPGETLQISIGSRAP